MTLDTPSRTPWLEDLSKSWRSVRLKFVKRGALEYGANEAAELDDPDLPRFIRITDIQEDGSLRDETFRSLPESVARRYLLQEGDILLARSGATVGKAFTYRRSWGRACFAGYLIRVRVDPRQASTEFLRYYTQSHCYQQEIRLSTIQATIQNVSAERYANFLVPLPSVDEQRAIVSFLDRKTAAIDALIAKKERFIELLQEKRRALITGAVTKGLDPNAPMKESGIPWIGKVPSTWKVLAVKRTAKPGRKTFTDGDWIESPFITEEGVRLIQTGNIGIGRYKEQGFRYVSERTFHELRCTEVDPGDVLICRLDGPVGRACLAPSLGVRMITSVDNAILKPRSECDGRFLVYVLSSPKYLDWVQVLCRVGGGFRFRVSRSMLGDIQIPVPPGDEQRRIANMLDAQTERSAALEQKLGLHCERLREYRQAVITAAVTGKIDLSREVA